MKGIYFSYELIASTVDTQTSNDEAVSDITFKASLFSTTNFAPPSKTCNDEPAGIGASLTR
jgi:hypothetical protein